MPSFIIHISKKYSYNKINKIKNVIIYKFKIKSFLTSSTIPLPEEEIVT